MVEQKLRGRLILVVGPSGAGKDSLIDVAKRHFAHDADVVFPNRYITRPADAGGEDHIEVSTTQFEAMVAQNQFMLHWGAHNLRYGIAQRIEDDLAAGKAVIINVSRAVIDQARVRYNTVVASVFVDPVVLEQRLRNRGRETETDIQHRLQRAPAYKVTGPDTTIIDNSGDILTSAAQMIDVIKNALQTYHHTKTQNDQNYQYNPSKQLF